MRYVQKLAVVEAVQVTAEMLEEHKGDPGYKQAIVGDYFVSHGGCPPVLMGGLAFEQQFEPCSDDYGGNDPTSMLIEGLHAANARIAALEKQVERLSAPQPPQVDVATAQKILAAEAKLSEAPPEQKAERSEKAKRA